jgi:hypothetical protein
MTSINPKCVSTPGCHPQGFFQIKGVQDQHANRGTHRPHWNEYNLLFVDMTYIKLYQDASKN